MKSKVLALFAFAGLLLEANAQPAPKQAVELVGAGVISTIQNDYNPILTKDGKTLYFARAASGFKGAKIMVSQLKKGKWAEPQQISFSDTHFTDSDPAISPDGKTLFFISNRPHSGMEEKEDLDIWYSLLDNGSWSAPKPVTGTGVNSKGDELGPELTPEGHLYFNTGRKSGTGSSDIFRVKYAQGVGTGLEEAKEGVNTVSFDADICFSPDGQYMAWSSWEPTKSLGKGDLFIAKKQKDGTWSAGVNLGPSINTTDFELTPFFSPDGKYLYYASFKQEGEGVASKELFNGESNIYRVSMKEVVQLLKKSPLASLE